MLRAETEDDPKENTAPLDVVVDDLALVGNDPVALSGLSGRVLAKISNPAKIVRYGSTSILALGISEATLLVLYAHGVGATKAAFIANLTGTIPSYLLSRYWIWPGADRRRAGRQIVAYWLVSLVSMTVSSVATGVVSGTAQRDRVLHLAILGSGYLVISFVLWIAKYLVYESAIFRQPTPSAA